MKKVRNSHDIAGTEALRLASAYLSGPDRRQLAIQVHGLLHALTEMEELAGRLTATQFHDVIHEAILACGFSDEADAWRGVMQHLESGKCRASSCRHHPHFG